MNKAIFSKMKGMLRIIMEYIARAIEAIDNTKCILYLSLRKKAYISNIMPI